MSVIRISSVNKVLALDPEAIESPIDWLKIYPFVGQHQGLFMAAFPRNWAHRFEMSSQRFEPSIWDFWNKERIKNALVEFERGNAFVRLGSPYDDQKSWYENYSGVDLAQRKDVLAYTSRDEVSIQQSIEHLDPADLQVGTTWTGDLSPKALVVLLRRYFRNSRKIALVDRNQSLVKEDGRASVFADFLRLLIQEVYNSKCHEILVYTRYDEGRYPYMSSNKSLLAQLKASLAGLKTPTYGVKYMCCSEIGARRTDLHARRIVTNHVVFTLADSIAGNTKSKMLTRVPDKAFREENLQAWIDEEHGLEVVSDAVFVSE